jgi:hypothetical protein
MTAPAQIFQPVRSLLPFALGIATVITLPQLGWWRNEPSLLTAILLEAGVFAFICLLGCLLAPNHPFQVGFIGSAGVFLGAVLDVFIHPTINGVERNLFPLEIAFHTLVAVVSFFPTALLWKVGRSLIR